MYKIKPLVWKYYRDSSYAFPLGRDYTFEIHKSPVDFKYMLRFLGDEAAFGTMQEAKDAAEILWKEYLISKILEEV